ncbi:hypothetical protein COCON_G00154320 [Conger conger]|uniref:Hyaluronan and proteoglycan link protein 1 n=1 Tax=Conger conger TaxID=82655 RepID=A0A9Q1HUN5_CONCO|nr:hyaluronan and proteoglycan link protein 1-like [Conger conger]KAJ8262975.1 hypothetical protein COCON_G00154320 [Conger conger]
MITLISIALLSLSLADSWPSPVYVSDEPHLTVVASQPKVITFRGGNATLPCRLDRDIEDAFGGSTMRIKWTKLSPDFSKEIDVLVSMGFHKKMYNGYNGRVHLQESDENDASLVFTEVRLEDVGKYKCEVIDGMDDATDVVSLELTGVVFPYSPRLGRYNLNYHDAEAACLEQDSVVANFDQLYEAWKGGFDWCNAGWLNDGSVQYPITTPRGPCGGNNTVPGLRNYGLRDKTKSRYDVFCFTSNFKGRFYYLNNGFNMTKFTYDEAAQACENDGSQIAKVGQMFAAWKLLGFDRCDAGWLADGSVRYPISNPRRRCSPTEAAVRFIGFPDKKHKLFGVYCFQAFD